MNPAELQTTLADVAELGSKLGVLLIQLPPKLEFESEIAEGFFEALRETYSGPVALEPRHPSWVSRDALKVMNEFGVSKVFADPDRCPLTVRQTPLNGLIYQRLHGTPEIYKSKYEADQLRQFFDRVVEAKTSVKEAWIIFDNTTFGHATGNALETLELRNLLR
ncbi:MAG: DUF72 domain-containing protein [Proteobacteria bacterium]|nr:MAG: DUF72 domain-containing protein [Pseudomonadota bacterium]